MEWLLETQNKPLWVITKIKVKEQNIWGSSYGMSLWQITSSLFLNARLEYTVNNTPGDLPRFGRCLWRTYALERGHENSKDLINLNTVSLIEEGSLGLHSLETVHPGYQSSFLESGSKVKFTWGSFSKVSVDNLAESILSGIWTCTPFTYPSKGFKSFQTLY